MIDYKKPVQTAEVTQAIEPLKGASNGVASLNGDAVVPSDQLTLIFEALADHIGESNPHGTTTDDLGALNINGDVMKGPLRFQNEVENLSSANYGSISDGEAAMYCTNGKLVIHYRDPLNPGDLVYVTLNLDGTANTFTISSTAP